MRGAERGRGGAQRGAERSGAERGARQRRRRRPTAPPGSSPGPAAPPARSAAAAAPSAGRSRSLQPRRASARSLRVLCAFFARCPCALFARSHRSPGPRRMGDGGPRGAGSREGAAGEGTGTEVEGDGDGARGAPALGTSGGERWRRMGQRASGAGDGAHPDRGRRRKTAGDGGPAMAPCWDGDGGHREPGTVPRGWGTAHGWGRRPWGRSDSAGRRGTLPRCNAGAAPAVPTPQDPSCPRADPALPHNAGSGGGRGHTGPMGVTGDGAEGHQTCSPRPSRPTPLLSQRPPRSAPTPSRTTFPIVLRFKGPLSWRGVPTPLPQRRGSPLDGAPRGWEHRWDGDNEAHGSPRGLQVLGEGGGR